MTENKKIPQWLYLKDNHPTMVKLNALFDLADKLGLNIRFENHATIIQDQESPDLQFFMQDLDHNAEPVQDLPPMLDFKVIRLNPAYIEAQRLEEEAWKQKLQDDMEKAEKIRELARARLKAEAEAAAIKLEQQERAQLAHLKNKYQE